MKIFKNILKLTVTTLAAAAVLSSCSDWTNPEPVDFHYVTIGEKNPELYEAYLQSLRDYRTSEHKIVIAKFDNKAGVPSGRAEHINCLPDSVDYIILKNADVISQAISSEMEEVRSLKGQKVLYEIDYKSIETAYKAYAQAWEDAHQPAEAAAEGGSGEGESGEQVEEKPLSLNEFVNESVLAQTKWLGEFGYDGVNVVFTSKNPASCTEEGKTELTALQEAFLAPVVDLLEKNPDALIFFEGTPQYLLCHESLVNRSNYLIVPAESAANEYECSYNLNLMMRLGNIPTDRFVLGVTAKSLEDPSLKPGSFTGTDRNGYAKTAIIGGAEWVVAGNADVKRAGICINNAKNDYFNLNKVYYNIREAISIMNPSPVK